jgi:hypothetical protein
MEFARETWEEMENGRKECKNEDEEEEIERRVGGQR